MNRPAKKDAKPRSKLQQVQAQANWAVHFKLQPFGSNYLSKLVVSRDTWCLVHQYNVLTELLKESIVKDAYETKGLIRDREAAAKIAEEEVAKAIAELNEPYLPF